jgi:hypothetical protein
MVETGIKQNWFIYAGGRKVFVMLLCLGYFSTGDTL